jgi:hypothetical protein
MNTECHGDFFPALGVYRCFGDGSFHDAATAPEVCPQCSRKADPRVHAEAQVARIVETDEVVTVYVEPWGWLDVAKKRQQVHEAREIDAVEFRRLWERIRERKVAPW